MLACIHVMDVSSCKTRESWWNRTSCRPGAFQNLLFSWNIMLRIFGRAFGALGSKSASPLLSLLRKVAARRDGSG